MFAAELTELKDVSWTKPKGGYFISLEVPKGCAKSVVLLAKEAGVVTPAGSTHPLGVDPEDPVIQIAPSFLRWRMWSRQRREWRFASGWRRGEMV